MNAGAIQPVLAGTAWVCQPFSYENARSGDEGDDNADTG